MGAHANARNPWRCPYCGNIKTVQGRPGHLKAASACRKAHEAAPDYRAGHPFTLLTPAEQAEVWSRTDVGVLCTERPTVADEPDPPEPGEPQRAGDEPEPPEDPEPEPEPEPEQRFGGFLAE